MEKKNIKDVSSSLRTAYQKAQEVLRKNNVDYAIELLKSVVQKDPAFVDARLLLREQEQKKSESLGAFAKIVANVKSSMIINKGKGKVKKDPLLAMNLAEEALALNLNSTSALNLLAEAAEGAKAYFVAVEAFETIDGFQPKNEFNLRNLARAYESNKQGREVLRIWQRISDLKPKDLEVQSSLRGAAALASMQNGNWEGKGDYQSRLKDKDESEAIEQEDRIVRNEDDVNEMIEHLEKQIANGDESIDLRRRLGDLYYRANRFDDSISTYNWIAEKMGVIDPSIDRGIEKSNVGKFDAAIAEQRNAGAEEQAQELEVQKYNYRLERAVDRVNKFPNDTELRYYLAVVYWEGDHIDNALEQFQIAQKNPHHRLSAIVHLGRCFQHKGQFDLAIEQLERAIEGMPTMDKIKMDAIYHLGVTFEKSGKADKAIDCFKQIYQVNVNYLDVSDKIKNFYEKQKEAEA